MRSKTKEGHLSYQGGKWHPVYCHLRSGKSFEEAIFTTLLGYGRGLWLDFQYPFHPKSLMATPPPDRWMAQEWPYDPIPAKATWGSVFWKAFGKDFSILRQQVQDRTASPLFLDMAVSGLTPGIATAWLRKTSTPKRKKKGMERTQVAEVQLWPFETGNMRDKKANLNWEFSATSYKKPSDWYPMVYTSWF